MAGFSVNKRERESAHHLLKNAWLGDDGVLFVKPEALSNVPESMTAEIALKFLSKANLLEQGQSLESERIVLNRKIVERNAGLRYSVKDLDKVELSDPEMLIALRLLASSDGTLTRDVGAEPVFSINERALNEIDPEGIARQRGWVEEMTGGNDRSALIGTSRVSREKLTEALGISHEQASGKEVRIDRGENAVRGPRSRAVGNREQTPSGGRE